MATPKLNPTLRAIYGKLIVKKYGRRTVLSAMPNMSRVKPSPKQRARRLFMQQAAAYYWEMLAQPAEKARLEALSRRTGLQISALTLREFTALERAKAKQAAQTSEPIATKPNPRALRAAANVRKEIGQALARLNTLLASRDPAIAQEFATGADVLLVGSERDEIVAGSDGLPAFFRTLFALPVRLGWHWRMTRIASSGAIAWIFAEGEVVLDDGGQTTRRPYRMSGVLEQRDGRWRWRMFHGAEPAK